MTVVLQFPLPADHRAQRSAQRPAQRSSRGLGDLPARDLVTDLIPTISEATTTGSTEQAAPSGESSLTLLETYLEHLVATPSPHSPGLAERARRLNQLLPWHDVEVLTDPRHIPGQRRNSRLWAEIDEASRRSAPASHRLMARTVQARLRDHEEALLDDNVLDEVRFYAPDDDLTPA